MCRPFPLVSDLRRILLLVLVSVWATAPSSAARPTDKEKGTQAPSVPQQVAEAQQALSVSEGAADARIQHKALTKLRNAYQASGAHEELLSTSIRCLELSEQLGDAGVLALDLQYISDAYLIIGDKEQAVENSRRAMYFHEVSGDRTSMANGGLHYLNVLLEADQIDEAIQQIQRTRDLFAALNDSSGLAHVALREGELALKQGQFKKAIGILEHAAPEFGGASMENERFAVLKLLTKAHIGLGQYALAEQVLERAKSLETSYGLPGERPEIFRLSSIIGEGLGRMQEALQDHKAYHVLQMQQQDQEAKARMAGSLALYKLNLKERANSQLRERNAMNEALIAGERKRNDLLMVVLGLFVLLLAGLLISIRRTMKAMQRVRLKNLVIQRQSEEIRTAAMDMEQQQIRLARSLVAEDEKEMMLKEIHHRVKNNLQIVNTLLSAQAGGASLQGIDELLEDTRSRVRSMAMVHEHMYSTGDLKKVDARTYLDQLGTKLLTSLGMEERVQLRLKVDHVEYGMDILVPLSLLINELVMNSAKHVFSKETTGHISISLERFPEGHQLTYWDSGSGMALDELLHGRTFGCRLMQALADQLGGKFRLLKGDGTRTVLLFQGEKPGLRIAS